MSRSPLLVSVTELLRRPGTRREAQRTISSPGYVVAGSTVPDGADVDIDVVVESTADPGTVTASGSITAPWQGECRRCLDVVEGTLEIELDEVFSRRIDPAEVDDVWPLEGEELDLSEVVADAILLALPLAPLCGPDCEGPDPEDAPVSIEGEVEEGDDDAEPPRDPRWAALDDLRFD